MSQENVAIIGRAYEAWDRRDIAAVLAACDPDIEWWEREDVPDPAVHRGLDAVGARFAELDGVWTGLSLEPQEFTDAGDFVVVIFCLRGRGRASGVPIEETEVQAFRLRTGRIVELREYRDKDEAL